MCTRPPVFCDFISYEIATKTLQNLSQKHIFSRAARSLSVWTKKEHCCHDMSRMTRALLIFLSFSSVKPDAKQVVVCSVFTQWPSWQGQCVFGFVDLHFKFAPCSSCLSHQLSFLSSRWMICKHCSLLHPFYLWHCLMQVIFICDLRKKMLVLRDKCHVKDTRILANML